MNIYAKLPFSSYEAEHLARVFYKNAQLCTQYSKGADTVYVRFGKISMAVGVRLNGKCVTVRENISVGASRSPTEKPEFLLYTMLYKALKQVTGFAPPWGLLTGVRPVRIIHDLRKAGVDDEQIKNRFLQIFDVSEEKTRISFQIADIQKPLMLQSTPRSFSLYISIPFCPSRCSYCSFVSRTTAQSKALMQPYTELLQRELNDIARLSQALNLKLETIYIGGGTPTSLSAEQLTEIMKTVKQCFDLSSVREYTVEAGRPDCTTQEKLHIIKQYGATRISINPQTMQDSVLSAIGRAHTAQAVTECFMQARAAGHNNINMDLIAGLPTDTAEGFKCSLNEIVSMSPENITVHTLTLKRASNLVIEQAAEKYDDVEQMINSCRVLAQNQYLPYYLYRQKNTLNCLENTGYCKPGFEGLYNIFIMEEVHTILSAGAGGSTKLVSANGKISRIFNYKYPHEYINNFETLLTKKKGVENFYACNVDT